MAAPRVNPKRTGPKRIKPNSCRGSPPFPKGCPLTESKSDQKGCPRTFRELRASRKCRRRDLPRLIFALQTRLAIFVGAEANVVSPERFGLPS